METSSKRQRERRLQEKRQDKEYRRIERAERKKYAAAHPNLVRSDSEHLPEDAPPSPEAPRATPAAILALAATKPSVTGHPAAGTAVRPPEIRS